MVGVRCVRLGLAGVAAVVFVLLVAMQPSLGQTVPDFEDVPEGHLAEDAIMWAAETGITVGVGNNLFGMGQTLTRYEMVTFLCRAFSPDTCRSGTMGSDRFEDVPVDHWANFSVGWAVQQGITSGVSATEFGGSRTLTREQIAAFLYRAKGSPSGGSLGSDVYTDVPSDRSQWANQPIGWAYDQGISGGIEPGTFGFGTFLAREEMVLFLCRTLAPTRCVPSQTPIPLPSTGTAPTVATFTAIAISGSHWCGILSDGTVACWVGEEASETDPPEGSFTSVAVGPSHSCALRDDGTVVCWGAGYSGQTDPPQGQFTSVVVGLGHSCALRSDGSVVCWGSNREGQLDAPEERFTQITAARNYSCGYRSDGSISCWGNQRPTPTGSFFVLFGTPRPVPTGMFATIAHGETHSCGLRSNSAIACWGWNFEGEIAAPWGRFSQISAGHEFSCGLHTDGSVSCWGLNDTGQTQPPEQEFTSISSGQNHSCGILADGSVSCWGANSTINPPDGKFTSISSGVGFSCGLRADGTVTCWHNNSWNPR